MSILISILRQNWKARLGVLIVLGFVLLAIFGPWFAEFAPERRVGLPHQPPDGSHWLGTTRMGQDVFSQFVHGARTSLAVGFGAGFIVAALGTLIGVVAGYFRGKVDEFLTFLTNVALVIPNLPLLLVLAAFIGSASPLVIMLIIGFTSWSWGARVIRAQTLALRDREFVHAAELLGEPRWRIIGVEILPNLVSIVGINFIGSVIYAVLTQATIEYLGLGNPLDVSWGIMLYNAQNSAALYVGAWWEVLAPCVAIALLGAGLALLNFAIDEMANPRLRTYRLNRRVRQRMAALSGKEVSA
ncbi:ABC transporter permease [Natronospirillum operosum]|uniref:ABC transporter permease n=1 Tax=Natronospirillum operosum TaxID=2759953 RepID=A0A4Z0WGJ4_9GAMM|nr:ABC transporter permease [Natronospirillum operosum]TGG93908.1 ABC transporter permease [Natronospirillum operosum]